MNFCGKGPLFLERVTYIYISSHVLSKIATNISIFHLGSYICGARIPGSAPWPANNSVDGSTVGKYALTVVIDCIRNFGGEGGQADIARHQMLIARNRHNRSGRVLGAVVYTCTSSVACALQEHHSRAIVGGSS